MSKKAKLLKYVFWIFGILLVIAGGFGYWLYDWIYKPNVPEQLASEILYIPTGSNYDDVKGRLTEGGFLKKDNSFDWVAKKMNYPGQIKAGRYHILPSWSNYHLIRHLRQGIQEPVKLTFNSVRTIAELSEKLAEQLEPNEKQFQEFLTRPGVLDSIGYSKETLMTIFIPNTYEVYWNVTPVQLLQRMIREHDSFWDKAGRKEKAEAQSLSPTEVYTLASIVEKESLREDEKPRIAGVYLNRLHQGMKLDADPTVVFAVGDFTLRRILNKHLAVDSPYNTYKYAGLPPGPICMPSISSLDAVLNAERHEYLFFCAKMDGTGSHAFAKTITAHLVNARRLHQYLNERGIQ